MIIENKIYSDLRQYIKDNNGYGSDLTKTKLWKQNLDFTDKLKSLAGKCLKISYVSSNYLGTAHCEKFGKIKVDQKEQVLFFERGFRKRHYYLDAGLHEGFFATLIPIKIEVLNKFPKRKNKSFAELYGLKVR